MTGSALGRLGERLAEVHDLERAATLLSWDERVMMPPNGAQARAEALGTVGRLAQERFIDGEVGRLLEELRDVEESSDPDSFEASLIRVTRRRYEKATRVPPELVGEIRRASALALAAWGPAKDASDFEGLRPHLEQILELRHRYVSCFPTPDETYDILLDDYEPEMKTAEVRRIFDELKEEQRPLIDELADAGDVDDSFLTGGFDPAAQRRVALEILRAFGYDEAEWRLDETRHPFMSSPGAGDLRLTTNSRRDDLTSLFATMHEFGHGLYEWGVDHALARTPLGTGVSLGLHESQSRMWENLVGRSRPFWRWFYPRLQEAFPAQLGSVDEESFYRAVNKVRPSLIRIDADEATYNLHIILRFELEQELVEGRLTVADLPDAWNARMKEYLGVDVPDDAHGVLQDMHWTGGAFGYFPTYALGNVMSVQIWERALDDLGDLDDRFERGEFGDLREWLRGRLYAMGAKFTPQETIERVTGSRIDAKPYLRYLREKLAPQVA
ncbi:MAG TPA: carboxypeptidase M32 [Gaiellaceae bacterium]|nr:carboxypeptidase M32 [Gaiellaceae bacterium]HWJ45778.1 carboxypeptidase M32 [Gaiellaceae bacterium]